MSGTKFDWEKKSGKYVLKCVKPERKGLSPVILTGGKENRRATFMEMGEKGLLTGRALKDYEKLKGRGSR